MERRDGKPSTHPRSNMVELADYINKIWEYRRENVPFDVIAEELGISSSTARKYFKEGYQMNAPPGAAEERILLVQQLEQLLYRAQQMLDGSVNDPDKAVKLLNVMSKLLKDKRELLGLDAAKKFEIKETVTTPLDNEIEGLMDKLGKETELRDTARAERLARRRKGFRP